MKRSGAVKITVLEISCLVLLLLVIVLGLPLIQRPRGRGGTGHSYCRGNLKQIGLALHNYHDAYDSFPPPYIADKNGKPMHSWRVLILPYMDHQKLYDEYDFSEPWNGPHNSTLADQIVATYCCPLQGKGRTTHFLALVGPETSFAPEKVRTHRDFVDGENQTLMVLEVTNSDVHWMEPHDIDVDPANWESLISKGLHEKKTGFWTKETGVHAMYANGSVRLLPSEISSEMLQWLTTINGGEKIPDEFK